MIKMKMFLFLLGFVWFSEPYICLGQTTDNSNEVPDFIGEYMAEVESGERAQNKASEILNKNLLNTKSQKNREIDNQKAEDGKKVLQEKIQQTKDWLKNENLKKNIVTDNDTEKAIKTKNSENVKSDILNDTMGYPKAPFGLFWGISKQQAEQKGLVLQPVSYEGYDNVYKVVNAKNNNNTFAAVYATFGQNDKLWSIIAQGKLINDDEKASRILEIYHKYYKALNNKYGNAREFFTPYTYQQSVTDSEGKEKLETKESTIGGDNFLLELQKNQTSLYAAFNNSDIGAILSVFANDGGKTFITLVYKHFALLREEKIAKEKNEKLTDDL